MLVQIIVVLLIIGVVVWFIGQIGQLDATIKKLIQAALIIVALLFCKRLASWALVPIQEGRCSGKKENLGWKG
jgi:hypothetical protein